MSNLTKIELNTIKIIFRLNETFFGSPLRAGVETLRQLFAHNFSRTMLLRICWCGTTITPGFERHLIWRGGFNLVVRGVEAAGSMCPESNFQGVQRQSPARRV
jgi:hypothetical protein